ncbi:aldo/keto reductase [Hyphomicrobium sp. CS1BSMeth3]|uniref:aldo/keto reductase n=1 Tax=Hyphomicrobium sp. CS1BSMeth3 TaxID=1892844 RepID=UPI0009310ADB|nr:aldo/keto reductase [Hyphomicrobium sp. CS1BSMeth3]
MISIVLPSGITTSKLGFGTARLHHMGSSKDRQRLLAAAFDLGLHHFDTAPSYGHGLAERELQTFLRPRRNSFTVATKYGIPAAGWIARAPLSAVRPALVLQKVASKVGLAREVWPELTSEGLRRTVEDSLRRLKVDVIDIHFLHEANLQRATRPQELAETYRSLIKQGLIRAFGIAGDFAGCAELKRQAGWEDAIVQTDEAQWSAELVPDITYRVIVSGPQQHGPSGLTDAEAIDRLYAAHLRRPNGMLLVSSTKVEHVASLAQGLAARLTPRFGEGPDTAGQANLPASQRP